MKGLFVKIGTTFGALVAVLGISIHNAGATIPSTHANIPDPQTITTGEITESTPLFLYHANQLVETDNDLLTWHYSHESHSSHYSHESHRSHYSSR